MSCRIAMRISPPWLAPPEAPRVMLRVMLTGGSNITLRRSDEVAAREPLWIVATGERFRRNLPYERELHAASDAVANQVGRRFLPPDELRIVRKPRRERPPTWPRMSTLRVVRGGRSRLGRISQLFDETGSRSAPHMPRKRAPKCRRPSLRHQFRSLGGVLRLPAHGA